MQFTKYESTDASAPVLNGTAGSLITVLDACLVNGYGAKAAAGWTKDFSGSNLGVYRGPSGSRLYMRVADSTTEATYRGYEVMTGVSTGTGAFPTTGQMTNGVYLRKSATADSVARPWRIFADDRTIYFFFKTGDVSGVWSTAMFGEIYSFKNNDAYNCLIAGRNDTYASNLQRNETFTWLSGYGVDTLLGGTALSTGIAGHYMARSYVQTGTSIAVSKHGDSIKGGASGYGGGNSAGNLPYASFYGVVAFPNGADGGIFLSPIYVAEASNYQIRGRMRGLYQWLHSADAAVDGDTFTGAGDFAGKTFFLNSYTAVTTANGSQKGIMVIETSNTLDTNIIS